MACVRARFNWYVAEEFLPRQLYKLYGFTGVTETVYWQTD